MIGKKFKVHYRMQGNDQVVRIVDVAASSASQAKEIVKGRNSGKAKIISAVEIR